MSGDIFAPRPAAHCAPLLHAIRCSQCSPAQSSAVQWCIVPQLSQQFLCNSIISIEPGQALILKAVTPSNFIQLGGVWTMV